MPFTNWSMKQQRVKKMSILLKSMKKMNLVKNQDLMMTLKKTIVNWLWKLLKVFTNHLDTIIPMCSGIVFVNGYYLTRKKLQTIIDLTNFSTITQFLVAFGLFIFIIFHGLPAIQQEEKIYCQIEDSKYYYFCAGHPQKFYIVLCYMTLVFLALYLALTIFNLLWLIIIPMRPLTQAMKLFKDEFKIFDTDSIDDLYDLYYNNYDLQLLLDLLASKSGITPCLKLLSILDKNLLEMTKASNAIVETVNDSESIDAIVTFDDAPIVKEVFAKVLNLKSIYSVEISPPIKTVSSMTLIASNTKKYNMFMIIGFHL